MELFLSKLLPLWLYPLGLAITLLALVTLVQLVMGRWKSGLLLVLVTAGLWLSSTNRVSEWLIWTLERDYPEVAMGMVESADAILVLGGALVPSETAQGAPNLSDGADRILHALRLYRAGKAPRVVVSGGQLPWAGAPRTEAELIAELLVDWGVPEDRILVEKVSANTYENALHSKALLEAHGIRRVLLVTSAFHMPRALAVFQRAGMDVQPAATDHLGARRTGAALLDWMPEAWPLYITSLAVKEYVGMAWYRYKGWL